MDTTPRTLPRLYLIIPCYNEEAVLPITAPLFRNELQRLTDSRLIAPDSRILFVDDGSRDATWGLIQGFAVQDPHFLGIRQSRNRGHQNAVYAGLMTARSLCDITISIDCDGQDDIGTMEDMVRAYLDGCEIVYGVRNARKTDSFFKRFSAQAFYKMMNHMGTEIVYNHADYRLVSSRVLQEFSNYREVNLFLRGLFPLVGFKSTSVYYERHERMAGKSKYPLRKMLSLAFEGITSLSITPLRLIIKMGLIVSAISFIGVIWSIIESLTGNTVQGWASTICIVCFMGGVQLICLGVIGEYIGKIYLEVKNRPRYILSDKCGEELTKAESTGQNPSPLQSPNPGNT